ncbi:MAG TPA: hypothetical protein VEO92_07080, partial [Candidatus Nitrosocosmicus sp.]|nr:hypothetical protein [Candidatus Nitrosocosmicus sp.]
LSSTRKTFVCSLSSPYTKPPLPFNPGDGYDCATGNFRQIRRTTLTSWARLKQLWTDKNTAA